MSNEDEELLRIIGAVEITAANKLTVMTADWLRQLLDYNPDTGEFRWRASCGNHMREGKLAGSIRRSDGYVAIGYNRTLYQAHRLAWLYVTGEWPLEQVYHANGNRSDNRFANLRLAMGANKHEGLTAERLRKLLDYDPKTGKFSWKARTSARVSIGRLAGNVSVNGYIEIGIDGTSYTAHRLAWLYVTGEWPPKEIDHINGQPTDNRFTNLRAATVSENQMNKKMPINNTSGVKGVTWHERGKKWMASIGVNKRSIYLGLFTHLEDAAAAYERAAEKYFGEFARPERDIESRRQPSLDLKELGILD
jgi:hypothetical protein